MQVQRVLLSVVLTTCLTLAATVTALATPGARYVIVFKTDQLPADAATRIASAGGRTHKAIAEIGVATASGDAAFAARIGRDPGVLAVGREHMYKLPPRLLVPASLDPPVEPAADGSYALQWDIRRIGAPAAWVRLPKVLPGAVVAVLDTGVMHTHPDLEGQLVAFKATSYCVTSGGSPSVPSYPTYSTFIDFDAHPSWTPADGCTDGDPSINAHGTHVAGTIAARFGGGAVVGVAPQARVAAYKVFDRFRFTDTTGLVDDVGAFDGPVWSAMVDAAVGGYPVISMSLGGVIDRSTPDGDASWHAWNRVAKLVTRLGTLIVAAAGNDALDLNGPLANVPSDLPSVMSTSATGTSQLAADQDGNLVAAPGSDVLAFYSNFGRPVDIAGPGGDCGPGGLDACDATYFVLSTVIIEEPGPDFGQPGYAYFAGTSMATPHVSAVAAVAYSLHPSWKPDHVRRWLLGTAENIGKQKFFGAGLVNMDAATR